MIDTSTFPQILSRNFLNQFIRSGLKIQMVASTDYDCPKNLYAIKIIPGNEHYPEGGYRFTFDEETLKNAVVGFLMHESFCNDCYYSYPVTYDLINATFMMVKSSLHCAISKGHLALLRDPNGWERFIEKSEVGQCRGYVATIEKE